MQALSKPVWLLLLAVLPLLATGCSGINTTQGVSPATFLLPGFFGQYQPGQQPGAQYYSGPQSETEGKPEALPANSATDLAPVPTLTPGTSAAL